MDISEVALRAEAAWLRSLAAAGFPQTRADGGFAVATGLESNSENGAVVDPSDLDGLDALVGWLRGHAVPATVLVTGPPDPDVTAHLIARGLQPERTGNNMGRLLADADRAVPRQEWQISEVTDLPALRRNQQVYADDGWWDDTDRHVDVAARLGFGAVRHWTAHHDGVPVGAASSFRFDDTVLLLHCCVDAKWRRRGIGTALTRVRLAAAAGQGAVRAVLFPSPDGYYLHHALGFDLAPVHLDRAFYLP